MSTSRRCLGLIRVRTSSSCCSMTGATRGIDTLKAASRIASAAIGRGCVPDDAHTFYCHERPTRHHLVKDRDQTIDVRLIVNDFDHDWQICRQLD